MIQRIQDKFTAAALLGFTGISILIEAVIFWGIVYLLYRWGFWQALFRMVW